jgi:hypothetical protein
MIAVFGHPVVVVELAGQLCDCGPDRLLILCRLEVHAELPPER